MNADLLPDIFLNIVDKLNFYWHMYIIIVIAVTGWLLSLKFSMSWQLKVLTSVSFLSFAGINFMALVDSYSFLEVTRLELEKHVTLENFPHLYAKITSISYKSRLWYVIGIHLCIDTIVLIAIWSSKVSSSLRAKNQT